VSVEDILVAVYEAVCRSWPYFLLVGSSVGLVALLAYLFGLLT